MDISYKSKKLKKELAEEKQMLRAYGAKQAKVLKRRLAVLRAAETLHDFWPPNTRPERCHELTGNRKGQLSMDLDQPYRLIFEVATDAPPLREDGGLDWSGVTAIKILGIENTHD